MLKTAPYTELNWRESSVNIALPNSRVSQIMLKNNMAVSSIQGHAAGVLQRETKFKNGGHPFTQ